MAPKHQNIHYLQVPLLDSFGSGLRVIFDFIHALQENRFCVLLTSKPEIMLLLSNCFIDFWDIYPSHLCISAAGRHGHAIACAGS